VIDIQDNLDNHRSMTALLAALDIADKHLKATDKGTYAISGKQDKPMKCIQRINGDYYYYVKTTSIRRCKSIIKKLTSFGMKLHLQKNEEAYLSMHRLPETEQEATAIRSLLGIVKRKPKSGHNFNVANGKM
jgi:hypothetical protein